MLAYTYVEHGKFELREKPKPEIINSRDAIIRVTLGSICTSDLHIKHGSVPRGKSSVRCPLKPSDSIPLCPNNPAH